MIRSWRARLATVRLCGAPAFALRALPLMAIFYALLYVDHDPASLLGRALAGYLELIAEAAGRLIHLFDPSVTVTGRSLAGRFPLEVVLDCGALDVQAIFAAAVIAFPAPWPRRVSGLALGLPALLLFNVLRIAILALVGARAPGWFHLLHEEVFQIVIVVGTALGFARWALWAKPGVPSSSIAGVPVAAA
jgi:exosortase/archaeosortase family protein